MGIIKSTFLLLSLPNILIIPSILLLHHSNKSQAFFSVTIPKTLHRLSTKQQIYNNILQKRLMNSGTTKLSNTKFISIPEAISKFESSTFIDGSWHLSKERNAREEYEKGPRIKGAYYFDIDDVALKGDILNPKNLPHMMPKKEMFGKVMDSFGIGPSSTIVIYTTKDCPFASRAYYTFTRLCQPSNQIYFMQGSLQEFIDAGGPVETEFKKSILQSDFSSDISSEYQAVDDENIVTMDQMLIEVSDESDSVIIDARSKARFNAEVPEPRPNLRRGHMPGAYNVPFTELLQDEDMTKFKCASEMKDVFKNAGVDVNTEKKVILSCGSGVTACVVAVALAECGRDPKNTFIYDGSWIEWVSWFYFFLSCLFTILYQSIISHNVCDHDFSHAKGSDLNTPIIA
jgi:thiosulfate/3-mercaptopyruvate sulfurtransferase